MKRIIAILIFPIYCLATVSSQVDKSGPFTITGLPQTIPTVVLFNQSSDLLVLDSGSSGTPHDPALTLTLGSDYTVTGGGYNTQNQLQAGNVVVNSGGANNVQINDNIVIMRNVPFTQGTSFSSTGILTPQMIENGLDKITTLSQQVNEIASRSLQFENFEFSSPLLNKAARSNNILGFDSNGNIAFYASPVSTAVTSVTGTANQITASPTTGNVVLSIPQSTQGFFNKTLAAPGNVTLSDAGSGTLSSGVYNIGVCAVDASGAEGSFDPLGYHQSNTITISSSHNITVSWNAVPGAASYRVYAYRQADSSTFMRCYNTANTSLTISVQPVGPVGTVTVTPSNTGGSLKNGTYYFGVNALFSDGQTISQSSVGIFPQAVITGSDQGSVALSWTAVTGAVSYNVFVVSGTDGSPRIPTKYFSTGSNSVTVTGTEPYIQNPSALINGMTDSSPSGAVVGSAFFQTGNNTNWFSADIKLIGDNPSDSSVQMFKYNSAAGFAGIKMGTETPSAINASLGLGTSSTLLTLGYGVTSPTNTAFSFDTALTPGGATSRMQIMPLIINSFAGATQNGIDIVEGDDSTGGAYMSFDNSSLAQVGSIRRASSTTVAFNTSSDERLKSSLRPWSLGRTFDDIPVGEFNWNLDGSVGHGTLAQELYKVYPDAVTVGGDDPKTKPWEVDYGKLTVPIIARVQEIDRDLDSRPCTLEIRLFELMALAGLCLGIRANLKRK